MHRIVQFLIISILAMSGLASAALNVQITITASSGGSFVGGVWTPTASPSRINVYDLLNQLNAGNVTVNTNVAGAESGDITVSSTVALDLMNTTSARTLTLNALNNVVINAAILQSGEGSTNFVNLVFNADNDSNGAGAVSISSAVNSGGGAVSAVGAGFTQTATGTLTTAGGACSVTSTAGYSLGGMVNTLGGSVSVSSTGAGSVANYIGTSGGNLTVSAGGNLTVTAGADLDATGGANTGKVTVVSVGGLLDFAGRLTGGIAAGNHIVSGSTGVLFQGGSSVDVVQLDVDATGTGNIEIRNLSNITLTQSGTFDTQNGDILLVSGATFTSITAGISMVARGSAGDVTVSAAMTCGAGGINLQAGSEVNVASSGTLSSTAGGNITINGGSFTISGMIITAGSNFSATSSGGGIVGNDITTSGGNLTVTCGGNLTATPGSMMDATGGANTGVVNARSTGGLFDLQAPVAGGFGTQFLAGGTGLILRTSFNVYALDLDVTGAGDIDLRAGATLTVATSATMDTANGDVILNGTSNFGASGGASILTAHGAAGDVRVNAEMTVGIGGITLRADNDVVIGAIITGNEGPCTLRSDLDNNGVGVVATSTALSTAGGSLTISGATFSFGGFISTSGANFTLSTAGGGSFGNDITTSGGNITVTASGAISIAAGADLDVSGGAGTGALSLTSSAGQVTIGGYLRAPGGDVVIFGNTGVVFNGDIEAARNVDVDCVTGNIAINATASIVNSGSVMAFDAANSTITTAAGAIITPGTSSKLHMQARTGSNNLTVTMPLNAGTGGLELFSDNDVVINSPVSATGPITLRADSDADTSGVLYISAPVNGANQPVTLRGSGLAVLANVDSTTGEIHIEPGTTGSANIAAELLGPSRIINGTAIFTTGSITGNSLIVNTAATLAFDNTSRTISPSTFTQQNPLGETRIRLGGTSAGQFNRVISTGTFNAGGKLAVQLQPGFTPTSGMSFDVFDFSGFTGSFSSTSLPALGVNQVWDTSQIATTGTLRILTSASPPFAQTVFTTDFDGALPEAIEAGTAGLVGVQGFSGLGQQNNQFGGNFLRSPTANVVKLQLSGLPPHNAVNIGFLLAAIDSLDGEGTYPSGDYFRIKLDGVTIFRESLANALKSQIQSYVPAPGSELARHQDLGFSGPGSYYTDSAYNFALEPRMQGIPHSSSTLTLEFMIEGVGIQGFNDESWAIDNLTVVTTNDNAFLKPRLTNFKVTYPVGVTPRFTGLLHGASPLATATLQSSPDQDGWADLYTQPVNVNGSASFIDVPDPSADNSPRNFYRVMIVEP
jgi:hypothetical protein